MLLRHSRSLVLVLVGVCLLAGAARAEAAGGLRGGEELARVYGAILDADFDRASHLLEDACPPAPNEACLVLDATRLLWRIQLDPGQTRWDEAFTKVVTNAVTATDAWTTRDKTNAEAWFYLGGAYAARVQFRVLRHENLAAARDGKRIKEALDEALRLQPTLDDGQFGLGLYEYYADVAPTAAKMLRFLLLLPGGDRARGLARMERARERGEILADEAAYQLHLIYLWYEHDPTQALSLLRQLSVRHPTNPLFWRLVGDVEDFYLHDRSASLATFRSLQDRVRTHRVNLPAQADVEARLGIARQLDALGDTDLAITELTPLITTEPEAPVGAGQEARLQLAAADDRIGLRADAERIYREVLATPPANDDHDVAGRARRGLQHRTDPTKARAYKLSLDGWRLFERGGSTTNATLMLEEAIGLDPQNAIARYRYGRLLMAQHQNPEALAQLELAAKAAISTGSAGSAPPTVVADAALAAGRLREIAQDRPSAMAHYRHAAEVFGASADTRNAARRALTRLEKLDPPRH
jgi:tetratricopeptide (TPR) repeat protein